MAGVVASNVRNIRAKSLSLRDSKEEAETVRKLQIRQEQIEYNNRWKQKVTLFKIILSTYLENIHIYSAQFTFKEQFEQLRCPLPWSRSQLHRSHYLPGGCGRQRLQVSGAPTYWTMLNR